jgi:hypothetical protein
LDEEARLAHTYYYGALHFLHIGVLIFANVFLYILFAGHMFVPMLFCSAYQGEGDNYWSGNYTMVTEVKGDANSTYFEQTYGELGQTIYSEGWLCQPDSIWIPLSCFEFPETDDERVLQFQRLAKIGWEHGGWSLVHSVLCVILVVVTAQM